jgi:hypothetical protein
MKQVDNRFWAGFNYKGPKIGSRLILCDHVSDDVLFQHTNLHIAHQLYSRMNAKIYNDLMGNNI